MHLVRPEVAFVPKRPPGPEPWREFGASKAAYDLWVPHVCGICCAKMIGDTLGLTNGTSVYSLTMECLAAGGFSAGEDGAIKGVFHRPLLHLLTARGLKGEIAAELHGGGIAAAVESRRFVILSLDLARAGHGLSGSHLVLLYGHDSREESYLLHDCSHVLAPDGKGLKLAAAELERLSNRKGLIIECPAYASAPGDGVKRIR